MQRKDDKRLIPYMVGVFLLVVALGVLLGPLVGGVLFIPLSVVSGVLAAFILFGRRVQSSVFKKAEGQTRCGRLGTGQHAGQWRVKQAVVGTTHLDAVHRVIGKPGVIFVAEGNSGRQAAARTREEEGCPRRRRHPDLRDRRRQRRRVRCRCPLERHINKLPRNIDGKRIDALDGRLQALGGKTGAAAMPKGPMPTGATMRGMQRTARRRS